MGVAALCIDLEGLDVNPIARGRRHERQRAGTASDIRVLAGRRESVGSSLLLLLFLLHTKKPCITPFLFLWHPPLLFISHLNMVSILL
jgi:hypothetical protein